MDLRGTARARLDQVLAFARTAGPRVAPSRRAVVTDSLVALVVFAAALASAKLTDNGSASVQVFVHGHAVTDLAGGRLRGLPWQVTAAALATSVPLAARRWRPLTALFVLIIGVIAFRRYATDVIFLAIVFAAYSAMVHSRYQGAAVLSMLPAGLLVTIGFWTAGPSPQYGIAPAPVGPVSPGAWRLPAVIVMVSLVLVAIVGNAIHAGNRIRLLQAEHELATRRALELERARIASELHDVVTHNVSVMIVQAGAARQVLADAPDQATAALLAVESSGRAAMAELRHLLGLLSPLTPAGPDGPDQAAGAGPGTRPAAAGQELRPQPGLSQLRPLVDRLTAAGLPVELRVGELPPGLPPGVDLAAFRVVQEALTNVLKHAGRPDTSVSVGCQQGDLVIEVADMGRPVPAAAPAVVPGAGRGLIGLRERAAVYGGSLTAGPAPDGGWLVRARLPVGPPGAVPVPPGAAPLPAGRP